MSVEDFTMIRDFIHERAGIFFAENKMYLVQNRLQKRMAELDMRSVRDYFYHVKYDVSMNEFNRLMDIITTNETSFYRNEPQLASFADEVLPSFLDQQRNSSGERTLRIWSAGCSTGEEPYTLAMIVLEKMGSIRDWKVEIAACDIAEQVLHKARVGEYTGITLRNVPPDVLERYFTRHGERYRVNPEVKALVKFSQMNLNEPRKIAMMSNMDVIFCRNVMIYFSDEVKRQIVRGFYNALKPGGYFYIGHSETLHGVSKAFRLVYLKNALVYRKEAAGSRPGWTTGEGASDPAEQAMAGAGRATVLLRQIKPTTPGK
jgi:chemotaxis protein methyltransferase CheR